MVRCEDTLKTVNLLLVAWLIGCEGDVIIEPSFIPRSCHSEPSWCGPDQDPKDQLWFNRLTSDGRTTSLCMQHEDSLTYVFGPLGQDPLERIAFLIQWGPEHSGILWADDERRLRFPELHGQSDVIAVERYFKGNQQDMLFAFRDGRGTEYQLVRSLIDGDGDCYIYLFITYEDTEEFHVARAE